MNNKTVLLTGCSRGIGYETYKLFYNEGWNVTGTSTTKKGVSKLQKEFPNGNFIKCKFPKDNLSELYDLKSIDVLINNAAEKYQYNNVMAVNVGVPYLLMKGVKEDCKIINISSDCAIRGQPGLSEYCASKHALRGLSLSLRAEGRNVSVVYPGRTDTEFNYNKGGLDPADIAKAIYFTAISEGDIDLFIYPRTEKIK